MSTRIGMIPFDGASIYVAHVAASVAGVELAVPLGESHCGELPQTPWVLPIISPASARTLAHALEVAATEAEVMMKQRET